MIDVEEVNREAAKSAKGVANGLPEGWIETTLDQVASIVRGISFPKDARTESPAPGLVACLRTTNVQRTVEWDDLWFVPEKHVKRKEQYVGTGDILISTANSLELVGKVAQVKAMPHVATLGAFISLIRSSEMVDPAFLYYQLSSGDVQEALRKVASTTTNISNISTGKLAKTKVRIAPLPEQRDIVSKIEELLTRLDAGVAGLKRVQAALKRYRAAVLKAACEGRLVPQDPNDEPSAKLLERILAERRARWAADLHAKGKDPAKAKYEEPAGPVTEGLPVLPEGWCWATFDKLCALIGGVTKGRDFKGRPTVRLPYLRVANVQRGRLDLSEMKEIEVLEAEVARYQLQNGDLVLTEGGDWDKLGRSAIWRDQIPCCIHQNHIFRARPYLPEMDTEWLMYYTNSEQGQTYFKEAAKQTTNLASINLTQLRACPVPIPPLREQRRIIDEVERRLSVVQALIETVSASFNRAERLRQAVLRRAFEGNLV